MIVSPQRDISTVIREELDNRLSLSLPLSFFPPPSTAVTMNITIRICYTQRRRHWLLPGRGLITAPFFNSYPPNPADISPLRNRTGVEGMILRSLSLDRAASSLVPRSSRVTTDEAFNAFSIRSLSSTTLIHHRVSKPRGLVSRGKNLRSTQKKFLFFFLPPSRFGSKFDRLSTRSSTVALRGRNVCEWRN